MSFSKEEISWLDLVRKHPVVYHIAVDNDCVWIEQCGFEEWYDVFTFNSYGQDFIIQLLDYIGCSASGC